MCSYNQTKCWPGSCGEELAKNCQCDTKFNRSEAICQMRQDTKPDIVTCQIAIYSKSGEAKQTPGGQKCSDLKDFYGNFQPTRLKFDMTSELTITTSSPDKYPYISESKFGVTDTTVNITKRTVSGSERSLSSRPIKQDNGSSLNVEATAFSNDVNVSLGESKYKLNDGERLCFHYEAKGGGYVKGYDFTKNTILAAEPYDKTVATKVICYRYDGAPPRHCLSYKNCTSYLSEPLQISQRIIRYPVIQVGLEGWFDPVPLNGKPEQASGIESYTITVNEVANGIVSTDKIFDVTLNKTTKSTSLNLTSVDGKPRLYSILLEVKDIADNVQQARRFVLFDESTNISVDNKRSFHVTSASTVTNYVWQTHHNDVCLDWTDYFYNEFYITNSVLGKIKPHDGIKDIYEQQSGVLPVSGTPNVHGITSFAFSWYVENGTMSEILVPNFLNQTYCHKLPLKDGQTYLLNIKATDIVNNTHQDNRTIHIDRSVPHINNIGLEKNGVRRLFAHGNTDLDKMSIAFEVIDQHSGIENVKWVFGTAEARGILGSGIVAPEIVGDRCPGNVTHCYCPDVGPCEDYKYSVSLNKLVSNGTNEGKHNRQYFFTIKATNNAKLINVEHLDIIVDDSPPVEGVVFEGISGKMDIDFTSDDEIMINWHGFIDHESGIKEYRVVMDDKCLNKTDLFFVNDANSMKNYTVVPFTESSVRVAVNFTGKRYTSVVAVNNAMEPSDVACSDGITRDKSPPSITNVRIQQGRWSESIYCKDGVAWLFTSDLKKRILPASTICSKRCQLNSPESDMFMVLPSELSSMTNDSDIIDFMCRTFSSFDIQNTIYLPNNHLFLQWNTGEFGSQIDDYYVGIGDEMSSESSIAFKATHMHTLFKISHLGVSSGQKFHVYIRSVNKANKQRTTVVGPIIIDETPPLVRSKPFVKIDKDWVIVGWENDTFFDSEQTGTIDKLFFEIVHDGIVISPLLQWRIRDSMLCPEFSGGCFRYPLKRMQRMDTDLGLNFTIKVHVYNDAGHFTETCTDNFKLPSRYPPGQAIVFDIDPELKDSVAVRQDTQIHFTTEQMCASWTGFKYHKEVHIEIGIGTTPIDANIVHFATVNNTSNFECIQSGNIKLHTRYFFLVKANSSGGTTISVSNGIELHNKTNIISSFIIASAFESVPIILTPLNLSRNTSSVARFCLTDKVLTGPIYTMVVFNVTHDSIVESDDVKFSRVNFKSDCSEITATFVAFTELPCFTINDGNTSLNVKINREISLTNSTIIKSDQISARWELSHLNLIDVMSFKLAVFQVGDIKSNSTDSTILPYEISTNLLRHTFKQFKIEANSKYYVVLKACTHVRCLEVSKATFEFEGGIKDNKIARPSISSNTGGCSSVNFTWSPYIAKSGMSFYLWAISRDKNANNNLIDWKFVPSSSQHTYSVNECIDVPSTGLGTLFVCVKGLSKAGNAETSCEMAKVESTNGINKELLYDLDIQHTSWNTIKEYYICAYSKVTNIDREMSVETLNEIRLCSNGFIIDSLPPSVGTVTIENHNGFTSGDKLDIRWSGFTDNIDVGILGYKNRLKYYSVAIGTRIGGEDLMNYTIVGDTNSVTEKLANTVDGMEIFVSVKATDQAGLYSIKSATVVIKDSSPPVPGVLVINGRKQGDVIITKSRCKIDLMGVNDPHSGIDYFEISVGSSQGLADVMRKKYFDTNLEIDMNGELHDGHDYFVTVVAYNRAGLSSRPIWQKFLLDKTPPSGGHVLDGHYQFKKDLNYQHGISSLYVHWHGFNDPHSRLLTYKVCLGTRPYLDDVRSFIDVGIRKEQIWNATFVPGQKYFSTVKACNDAGLCHERSSNGIILDNSPPIAGVVIVGIDSKHKKYHPDRTSINIQWVGFSDPQSNIDHYETCIGTLPQQCNIKPFTTCMLQSHMVMTNLQLEESKGYYVTVKATNRAGMNITSTSDEFKIDDTPPVLIAKPYFVEQFSLKTNNIQYEKSIIYIKWHFEDKESGITSHLVTLKTHHEGHSPIEYVHVGDVKELTITLDKENWLSNGDTYFVVVSSCNAAGLCTTAHSENILIDSTPPHQGGLKPPMHWQNFLNSKGQKRCNVSLTWYGFYDAESKVDKYYLTVSKTYSGQELSGGIVMHTANHTANTTDQTTSLILDDYLNDGDKIILTVWAQNMAGLNSTVARVTVFTIPMTKGAVADNNGILEIERHSCDVHFCNGDCTCAVVGKPCLQTTVNTSCTNITQSDFSNSTSLPAIRVFGGLLSQPVNITGSSACLTGHWNASGGDDAIHRYEWSIGLTGQPVGKGVFDHNEIPWKDIGKLNQVVYCKLQSGLEHDTDYSVYVKAWFSKSSYSISESPPIHTDHSSPHIGKGKTIKDSDTYCRKDYDIIDWMDTMTACWTGVFSEQQGEITHYSVSLGSTLNGSDIFPQIDVELLTSYTLVNISLSHGTKYYFTVTAYNNVGLHTTLSSDGFLVDMDTPIEGVVFNTDRYVDSTFQSSISSFTMSWHGFLDHHSGIRSYFVAVTDVLGATYTNVSFSDVSMKTSHIFTNIVLQHGHSYVGLVKAIDDAGHVSKVVKSRPKMIDITPPFISSCRQSRLRYANEFSEEMVTFILNITKSTFHVINGYFKDYRIGVEPRLSINRFKVIAPIIVNNNGSAEFQYHFLAPDDYDEVNATLSIQFDESKFQSTSIYITVSECLLSTNGQNQLSEMEVQQIGLSKLKITALLSDMESSITKVDVGVGTTPGSLQLSKLSTLPHNGIIDVDLVHEAQVYVTLIAYNNANLKSTFHSSPLLIDKTPPVVSSIEASVIEVHNSTGNGVIDVKWNVEDKESNVKYCNCGLGTELHLTDIEPYFKTIGINSCQFSNLSLMHGKHVYVAVKCVNSIELSSVPAYKEVQVILQPPLIDNADLKIISASDVRIHRNVSPVIEADLYVLTNASSVIMEWSDFLDVTEIDHYEYRLKLENKTIVDWSKCYQSTAEIHGSHLTSDEKYTAEVRAVNYGLFKSNSIKSDIIIHNQRPRLSGEPVLLYRDGQRINIDWSNAFNLIDDLGATFDVAVGTRPGFTDILELNRVELDKYTFEMPNSTIITPDISELFFTITCTYSTGSYSVYKSNYKM
ncbi:hypothetical protein ACF0H5_020314 [Mactra antiquata]